MPSIQDRITTLETKLKQLQAKRRQINSRMRAIESKKKRSEDIRRKALIGQFVLATIASHSGGARQNDLLRDLDATLTSAADRELFDLPVCPAEQPVTPPDQPIYRADDPGDDIIMFPCGFDPWDDITDPEVKTTLERMSQAKRDVAISALKKAFAGSFFNVCPMDAITMYRERNPANTLLYALHCTNFEQMPMDVRVILYRAAMQCVREYLAHRPVTLEFSDFPFPERLRPPASLFSTLEEGWFDPEPVPDDIPYPQEMATPQELTALLQMTTAECPAPDFYRDPSKNVDAFINRKRMALAALLIVVFVLLGVFLTVSDHPITDAPLPPAPGIISQPFSQQLLPNEVTPHAPAPSSAH